MFKSIFKSFTATKWNVLNRNLTRIAGTRVKELMLKQYANSPEMSESIQLASHLLPEETKLTSKQAFIRLLASPINPADVNIIQGLHFIFFFFLFIYFKI